jgi:hypothetical protein
MGGRSPRPFDPLQRRTFPWALSRCSAFGIRRPSEHLNHPAVRIFGRPPAGATSNPPRDASALVALDALPLARLPWPSCAREVIGFRRPTECAQADICSLRSRWKSVRASLVPRCALRGELGLRAWVAPYSIREAPSRADSPDAHPSAPVTCKVWAVPSFPGPHCHQRPLSPVPRARAAPLHSKVRQRRLGSARGPGPFAGQVCCFPWSRAAFESYF